MADDKLGSQLLQLKRTIETKKSERSELQGELKSITKQLHDDFGVDTIEAAQELLEKKEQELKKLTEDIQNKIDEIEEVMSCQ